jgi:hypothetical protein
MDGTRARAHGRDTRHGAQAQPTCANTPRPRPRRLLLGTFRVVSFEAHFDWLFLFFEALTVLLLARRGFEKHEGGPRQSQRHSGFSTLHPLPAVFGAGSSSPPSLSRRTNDAPCVPVMPGS